MHKLEAFADFGFPESHSVSFAYLVYSSSWIKLHYPAEFACALLNAQPMGFYSPHTIVRDAMPPRRRGARARASSGRAATARSSPAPRRPGPSARPRPGWHADPSIHAVRRRAAVRARAARRAARPHRRRTRRAAVHRPRRLHPPHRRAHRRARGARHRGRVRRASARTRRERAVGRGRAARRAARASCRAWSPGADAPAAAGHDRGGGDRRRPLGHRAVARRATPPSSCATSSRRRGVVTAAALRELPDRTVVEVAGVVTHRQQPETAKGVVFLNLEDETGLVNVICTARRVEALPQGGARRARAADPRACSSATRA